MSDTDHDKVTTEVDQELTRVMESVIKAQAPKGQRRFRFAIGTLCLAPFCVAVAFFPWPSDTFLAKLMWLGYGLLFLIVGGWNLDKSNKELSAADKLDKLSNPRELVTSRNVFSLNKKR